MTANAKTLYFTAMCLWEAVLEDEGKDTPKLPWIHAYRATFGACETRERIADMVEACENAWAYAQDYLGYDLCFDWEFVPAFLALGTTWGFPNSRLTMSKTPTQIAEDVTTLHYPGDF